MFLTPIVCNVNQPILPTPCVFFTSPPLPPLPGLVVKHVSFDLRTDLASVCPVVLTPARHRYPILKTSRFGNGPRSLNPPSVVVLTDCASSNIFQSVVSALHTTACENLKFPSPAVSSLHAAECENLKSTLIIHCRDDQKLPLASFYPQFRNCESFDDVLNLSKKLAPCAFDMSKALTAHHKNPLILDPTLIASHVEQISTLGLRPFLKLASTAVLPITLQADVVARDFSTVSSFNCLSTIAQHGITTSVDPSFQANGGYNCDTYDASIADSDVLCNLLSKGHRNGRFIAIPLSLAQSCAATEGLLIHGSPLFVAAKRDDDLGRLVVNYSAAGPNHIDKKTSLPVIFGKINSPQLGFICLLIENAHLVFPQSISLLQGIRRDIDGAFHRMRYSLESILLCSTQLMIGGILYAIFSTVALMGDQDVNYGFNQITLAITEKVSAFVAELTHSPLPLSGAYVDDVFAFGDPSFIDRVSDQIGSLIGDGRAPGLCSPGSAIKLSKDIRGSIVEVLGWLFDVPLKSVQPNYLTFAKLVYYFFVAVGDTPTAGQPISVRLLMILGAHAMRAANILTPMLGHSRSFHFNIRGSCDPSSYVFLTQRTVTDIYLWRCLLHMSFFDARVLRTTTSSPLLRMKVYPDEPFSARGLRSIQRADIWAYSDACTGTHSSTTFQHPDSFCGIGGYVPGLAWFGARFEEFSTMCLPSGLLVDTNINILELFALLTTATLAIQQLQSMQSSTGCHIHIYCDNMSAISKCRTHRSNHPVYTYLLQLLSLLQLRNRCTVGTSFLKGVDNPVADAASRTFLVPQAFTIYHRHLAHLPYMSLSANSIITMQNQLMTLPELGSSPRPPQPISLVRTISPNFLPVMD